jgi:hypothetical protein
MEIPVLSTPYDHPDKAPDIQIASMPKKKKPSQSINQEGPIYLKNELLVRFQFNIPKIFPPTLDNLKLDSADSSSHCAALVYVLTTV